MIKLRLKALIYRYLGIYLAQKEEDVFVLGELFRRGFTKLGSQSQKNYNSEIIRSILVGTWQADNGFARPISKFWYKKGALWVFINWITTFLLVLKFDLYTLMRKIFRL